MSKNLLVSNNIYYEIDSLFYKKNKFEHLPLNLSHINNNDDYDLILNSYDFYKSENIIVVLDEMMFDNISKTSHPFNSQYHTTNSILTDEELFLQNFKNFFEKFPKNSKFIYYDNSAEASLPVTRRFILKWLEMNPYNYFISSRFSNFKHERVISDLIYLPIIYSFYLQEFNEYPMLEFSSSTNPKYDFVTYLGHTTKPDKIEYRKDFLKIILNESFDKIKYKDVYIVGNENLGNGKKGHIWNLLNSLTAKVQIIFETTNPTEWYNDDFFSEKTMKCFLLAHPYILLVRGNTLKKLEQYGFQFPVKCSTINEYQTEFNYISSNLDEWILDNQLIFKDNQLNFYNMINSSTLPHHLFLQKIITT